MADILRNITNRLFGCLIIMAIVISIGQSIVQATSLSDKKDIILLDDERLNVTYTVAKEDNHRLSWSIMFNKKWAEKQTILSIRLTDDLGQLVQPSATSKFKQSNDGLQEVKPSIDLEELLVFETDASLNELSLQVALYDDRGKSQLSVAPTHTFRLMNEKLNKSIPDNDQSESFTRNHSLSITDSSPTDSPLQDATMFRANTPVSYLSMEDYKYETNVDGVTGNQSLVNGTSLYTDSVASPAIKNYPFETSLKNTEWIKRQQSFESGYHSFIDESSGANVLMKKIVKPVVNDPTKFDVQLDVFGGKKETRQPLDVVFVVDKSSSMNEVISGGYRWHILKQAINSFTRNLSSEKVFDIRYGMVSFGSVPKYPQDYRYGYNIFSEISQFDNRDYFTNNVRELTQSPILNSDWAPQNSGTPTFLGVDTGQRLLTNNYFGTRNNAKKIMIILTDGLPTYGPSTRYPTMDINGYMNYYNSVGLNGDNYVGNGGKDAIDSVWKTTKPFITNLYNQNKTIQRYSLGLALKNDQLANEVLKQLGPNGSYNAHSSTQINTMLDEIKQQITSSNIFVNDADLVDPMSEFVTLDTKSVKSHQLTLNNGSIEAKENDRDADLTITPEKLERDDLTLSGDGTKREGYRLTYRVQLKEAYQDGYFYPTNKETYLSDKHWEQVLNVALPSIAYQKTENLMVTKKWDDSDNYYNLRPDKLTVDLEEKMDGTWRKIKQSIELTKNKDWQTSFSKLPVYKKGQAVAYRIVEHLPKGYIQAKSTTSVDKLTENAQVQLNNQLLTLQNFVFYKIDRDKNKLAGAEFRLERQSSVSGKWEKLEEKIVSDSQGRLKLPNLILGEYRLIEEKAPIGFQVNETPKTFTVSVNTANNSQLMMTNSESPMIINDKKRVNLTIKKIDAKSKREIDNGKFELKYSGKTQEVIGNQKEVIELILGQNYTLTEMIAPEGYQKLKQPIKLNIDNNGTVQVSEDTLVKVNFDQSKQTIELIIGNYAKGQLPQTGGTNHPLYYLLGLGSLIISAVLIIIYLLKTPKRRTR